MPANISNVNTAVGFNQAATILNSIVQQATGKTSLTATSTAEFVSQAQTALLTGVDPLMNAISTVLSKTIFSIRPYNARFLGLQRDAVQWGNHVRKINFGGDGVENEDRYDLADGYSVDQQIVKKPDILQTNWYSYDSYQNHYTIFRDQLDMAFQGPEEFMRFVTGVITEVSNKLEQYRENFARMTLCNLIGSTANLGRVRHLLTEFATEMGITKTVEVEGVDTTVPDPDSVLPTYMDGFVKWLFAELRVLSDRFTERSLLYQTQITGHDIYRHTPKAMQRLYIYSPFLAQVDARVLSAVYNPGYLNLGEREEVTYWQSINTPGSVNVVPSQITPEAIVASSTPAGAYVKGDAYNAPILGILMDYEAAGTTQVHEWSAPAPFNARGGYTTVWYHMDMRGWNDNTEKAVVLALD